MKKIIFSIMLLLLIPNINAASSVSYNQCSLYFDEFYTSLITPDNYLKDEVYFLSQREYKAIGSSSYLNNGYKTLTSTDVETDSSRVYYIDEKGNYSNSVSKDDANMFTKAVMYVKPDSRVVGYGTEDNPYKFVASNDINISAIYIDGVPVNTTPTYGDGIYSMIPQCVGGYATWNKNTYEINIIINSAPVECVLRFYKEE